MSPGWTWRKLMIGSFGTLAAIAVVNFKVLPMPRSGAQLSAVASIRWPTAIAARDRILKGVLQPAAIDLLNPAAAAHAGQRRVAAGRAGRRQRGRGRTLRAGVRALADGVRSMDERSETRFWTHVRELHAALSATSTRMARWCAFRVRWRSWKRSWRRSTGPAVARAGSGVCYAYFDTLAGRRGLDGRGGASRLEGVIEFAPEAQKPRTRAVAVSRRRL